MNILLADDEVLARTRLKSLLRDIEGDYTLVAEATNGQQVVDICAQKQIDIALLDIRMPGLDGIEAAFLLAKLDKPPAIIFVTAYQEYALKAFEANAIDYLLKPIRQERLQQALEKAAVLSMAQLDAMHSMQGYLSVSYRGGLKKIPIVEVLSLKADQKYVEVTTKEGVGLSELSLSAIEQEFPKLFLRIHRNALIAFDAVRELQKMPDGKTVLICEGKALEVSRRHLPEVRRLLK